MKKKIIIISSFILIVSLGFFTLFKTNIIKTNTKEYAARTANTKYYDYSAIRKLDPKYSYSSLFYSSESEFIVLSGTPTANFEFGDGRTGPNFANIETNGDVKFVITKSGLNSQGQLLDTVISVNDVNLWKEDGSIGIFFINYQFLNSQFAPAADSQDYIKQIFPGDLLLLNLSATWADCTFTIDYYLSGTVNSQGVGTKAGITSINSFYYDIDVVNRDTSRDWSPYLLDGYEGFVPQNGASTIYYNKNKTLPEGTAFEATLQEIDQGLAVKTLGSNTNGIYYATSAFMITDNVDSSFSFKYGGLGAGMTFGFISPYPYEAPGPMKSIPNKKSKYIVGESYTYKVSQYVPNNYYGGIINFSEVYNNLYSDTRFTGFVLKDTIDDRLIVGNPTVTNELDEDVSSNFTITKNGQNVVATAKSNVFANSNFYNHTYSLNIPVTIRESGILSKTISNIGNTVTTIADQPSSDDDTNEVITDIYYTVTTKYLEENTNKVLAPELVIDKQHGDSYQTTISTQVSNNYELIEVPSNATGTINGSNVEVIYYYRLKDGDLKVRHLEEGTNQPVGSEINREMHWGDEYRTTPATDLDWRYELVQTPSNANGVIDSDLVTVTYYYRKKNSVVVTKYVDEDTNNELITDNRQNKKYGDEYTTSEDSRLPKNYEFKRKTDNYTGIVDSDEIVVYYYYSKKDSKLTNEINKSGDVSVTNKNQIVNYTINYNVNVKDYIGEGKFTIIDYLPNTIDVNLSDLDGGIYNSSNNSIKWEITRDVDSYSDGSNEINVSITKYLKIYYKDVNGIIRGLNNNVIGEVELDNNSNNTSNDYYTPVEIPSKIIVRYVDDETGEEISEETEIIDLIGEVKTITPKEIKGWDIKTRPDNENIVIDEDTTIVTYTYEKAKVRVITDSGKGGTIIGDEIVTYGGDSTKDKIVVIAENGYYIDKITINGREIKIPPKSTNLVLNNFINMEENKNIKVTFKKKLNNPKTDSSQLVVISLIFFSIISIFYYLFRFNQEKKQY